MSKTRSVHRTPSNRFSGLAATPGQNNGYRPFDIIVIGDVFKETLILPLSEAEQNITNTLSGHNDSDTGQSYWRVENRSGALLLADVIEAACSYKDTAKRSRTDSLKVYDYSGLLNSARKELDINDCKELLTTLDLYPKVYKAKDSSRVYRIEKIRAVYDPALGTARQDSAKAIDRLIKGLQEKLEHDDKNDPHDRRILVIYDRNDAFRESDSARNFLKSQIERWGEKVSIILAMSSPLGRGKIWEMIEQRNFQHQCIVIVSENSVLRSGGLLPATASMEEGVEAFLESKNTNPVLKRISQCRHLVVRLNDGTVVHWDNDGARTVLTHHGFPFVKRGHEPRSNEVGGVAGKTIILAASIVRAIRTALSNGQNLSKNIDDGIRLGAVLMKEHFREGLAKPGFHKDITTTKELNARPFRELFERYADDQLRERYTHDEQREFHVVSVGVPVTAGKIERNWSRVAGFLRETDLEPEQTIYNVVLHGLHRVVASDVNPGKPSGTDGRDWYPPIMLDFPYAPYGVIYATDRDEISAFESVASIMRKYLKDKWETPLSIAVFGKPGSGKGFSIKEIFKTVKPVSEVETLEFNVAQFDEEKEITNAFHQAQDRALLKDVPLIFFDEFDASELRWLKYFLAPMQDGTFKGAAGTYHVGRAILVFCGGVYTTFQEFVDGRHSGSRGEIDSNFLKNKKVPDFVSRLRAHLDIRGINEEVNPRDKEAQHLKMFRRAVILRSILERYAKVVIDQRTKKARIQEPVIRAFLEVPQYKHGIRSMEAIIQMSSIPERPGFTMSSLPPKPQLEMHVDADEFWALSMSPIYDNQGKT
jgi:hypothetical protein